MDVLCGEVYLTLMGKIKFHCILCEDKYNRFQKYAEHVKEMHFPYLNHSNSKKESESCDVHDDQIKTKENSIDQYPAKVPIFMIDEEEKVPTLPSADVLHQKDTESIDISIDIIKSEYEITKSSQNNIWNEKDTDEKEDVIINMSREPSIEKNYKCDFSDDMKNAMKNNTKRHFNGNPFISPTKKNNLEIKSKKSKLIKDLPSITPETDDIKLKCATCDFIFNDRKNIWSYIKQRPANKSLQCRKCLESKERNMPIEEEQIFICKLCGLSLTNLKRLEYHTKKHIDKRKRKRIGNFEVHLSSDDFELPHICSICTKGFEECDELILHMKEHGL